MEEWAVDCPPPASYCFLQRKIPDFIYDFQEIGTFSKCNVKQYYLILQNEIVPFSPKFQILSTILRVGKSILRSWRWKVSISE